MHDFLPEHARGASACHSPGGPSTSSTGNSNPGNPAITPHNGHHPSSTRHTQRHRSAAPACRPPQCKQVRGIHAVKTWPCLQREREGYLGTYSPEFPHPEEGSPDLEPPARARLGSTRFLSSTSPPGQFLHLAMTIEAGFRTFLEAPVFIEASLARSPAVQMNSSPQSLHAVALDVFKFGHLVLRFFSSQLRRFWLQTSTDLHVDDTWQASEQEQAFPEQVSS